MGNDTRTFSTGATKDTNDNKLRYEGFLSPLVLRRFAEYMHKKRLVNIPEGQTVRAPDNWQKGIDRDAYIDSAIRHQMEWWLIHRGYEAVDEKGNVMNIEEVLCAVMFNAMGYLFEILKEKK